MINPSHQLPPAPSEIVLTHALAAINCIPPIERAILFTLLAYLAPATGEG